MGLKILNIDKEADRELITTFADRTTAPLDDEPAEAFDAYVAYYLSPLWIEDYKTADFEAVYNEEFPGERDQDLFNQWVAWAEEYSWDDRVAVAYYQARAQPLV